MLRRRRGRPAADALAPDSTLARTRPSRPVLRAVAQFALTGLAAVVLLGGIGIAAVSRIAQREAVRDARDLASLAGHSVVEPELTAGLLAGRRADVRRLDRVVRARVLGGAVVRVKLWAPDGRIVYSDEPRLVGARYVLGADERSVLATGAAEAEETDLSRPENRFEQPGRKLLEVYLRVRAPDGSPLLYEEYLLQSKVSADSRDVVRAFVPPLAAALLLLWAAQLPLAASLARRLRREQEEREALLVRAADASLEERRRIAADLHDRVVQDLAGTAFALEAAARRSPAADAGLAASLRDAASSTRASMRRLRSLLVEIYPPRLREAGLEAALADVLAPAGTRGLDVTLDVEEDLPLDADGRSLVFRTAQEAVRNAVAHADARSLRVTVAARGGAVELVVEDDGRGFDAGDAEASRRAGHLGLSLLADRAAAAGGRLDVASAPGRGTRVRLEVPAA